MNWQAISRALNNAAKSLDRFSKSFRTPTGGGGGGSNDSLFGGLGNYLKFILVSSNISKIFGAIGGLKNELDDLQKTLLGFGTDTGKFSNFLGDSIKGLDGSTLKNLRNATTLYGMGFRENNNRLLQVASVFDRTGQDTKGLLESMPDLAFNLRLNTAGAYNLAMSTLATGEKYGVASDKLIKVVQSLPVFKFAGLTEFGPQVAKAFQDITARLGPAGEGVAQFISTFLTSQEGMATAAAAGALGLRGQLEKAMAAGDMENAFKIAQQAAEKISNFTGNVFLNSAKAMKSSMGELGAISIMGSQIGELGMQAIKTKDSMKNFDLSLLGSAEKNTNYSDSLDTAIQELVSKVIPPLVHVLHFLTGTVQVISKMFDNSFVKIVLAVGAVVPVFKLIASGAAKLSAAFERASYQLAVASRMNSRFGGGAGAGLAAGALLGGPIGIALGIAALAIPAVMAYNEKTEENTRRAAEAAQRQVDLAQQEADARKAASSKDSNPYSTVFQMINKDLMYMVSTMRLDDEQARQEMQENNDILKIIAEELKRSSDGKTDPRKAAGVGAKP